MDATTLAEILPSVALAIALAACAGLRAWLPLLLAGGLARTGHIELGPSYEFLASNKALLVFGVATLIEVVADKVPVLDHALDSVSTLLRPAAGALLAAAVVGRFTDPLTALALGTAIGAPSALVPHAAKSALRLASTGFTAGLGNPVLSVMEDGVTVVACVLAVLAPLVVAAVMVLAAFFVLRRTCSRRPPPVHAT